MKKEIIVKNIGKEKEYDTDYYYNDNKADINELIDFLNEAKKQGATFIEFSGRAEYDSCSSLEEVRLQPVMVKEESDYDYNKRLEKDSESKKQALIMKEKMERQEFERLRKKYD